MTALSTPRRRNDTGPQPDKRDSQPTEDSIQRVGAQNGSRQEEHAPPVPLRKKRTPYYPTGDGKPMAEDVLHRKLMAYCCDALETYFAARPDVLVAGNDFVYYEEGNPKARVSPDCYVVLGVEPRGIRHFYKVWEENNIAPAVVIELTSKKTKKEDVTLKRPLYEQVLRVTEYFQFDPTGDYLSPRLQGQRLVEGVYRPIELHDDRMTSEQLGLELVVEGETLRLYDPAGGTFLLTYAQTEAQRLAEAQRAEAEAQRAEAEAQRAEQQARRAEAEAQRAEQQARRAEQQARRAEAADQRAQAADQRAQEEADRAELETQRADDEAQRAAAAEAEMKRLRQELDALRRQN